MRDKDLERAVDVLFEGEGHDRYDVPLHILHRPRHRGDEHRQHHGHGGPGEDREIGTLRALGLKRRGVSMLFAMEGGLLGLLGSLLGVVLHVIGVGNHKAVGPTYTPPGISAPCR